MILLFLLLPPPTLIPQKTLSFIFFSAEELPGMLAFMAQVLFNIFFENAVHHPLIILPYFFL